VYALCVIGFLSRRKSSNIISACNAFISFYTHYVAYDTPIVMCTESSYQTSLNSAGETRAAALALHYIRLDLAREAHGGCRW